MRGGRCDRSDTRIPVGRSEASWSDRGGGRGRSSNDGEGRWIEEARQRLSNKVFDQGCRPGNADDKGGKLVGGWGRTGRERRAGSGLGRGTPEGRRGKILVGVWVERSSGDIKWWYVYRRRLKGLGAPSRLGLSSVVGAPRNPTDPNAPKSTKRRPPTLKKKDTYEET